MKRINVILLSDVITIQFASNHLISIWSTGI